MGPDRPWPKDSEGSMAGTKLREPLATGLGFRKAQLLLRSSQPCCSCTHTYTCTSTHRKNTHACMRTHGTTCTHTCAPHIVLSGCCWGLSTSASLSLRPRALTQTPSKACRAEAPSQLAPSMCAVHTWEGTSGLAVTCRGLSFAEFQTSFPQVPMSPAHWGHSELCPLPLGPWHWAKRE